MADIFEAIADPTRRQLLETILASNLVGGSGELTVSELVEKTGIGQPTVSKHLKTLREVNLVAVREDGQKRFYSITAEPLEEIEDWMINFLSLDFDAEAEDETELAHTLSVAGERLGSWITERGGWLQDQLKSRLADVDVDINVSDLGKRLGRKIFDAQSEAEKSVKDFEKVARAKVEEVVDEVKSEASNFAKEVKSKIKR
ncbi:MAG: metalloregulator ArsR/SmtB family transcription factor [Aquiluna sp.]|nr:metalloregulator ArsR/SmtB family transcription factor [Aquiluna sp.]MCF8545547.1 metalloregulator ArsR/SmtB family transcription factor [Aquiluna sp.]